MDILNTAIAEKVLEISNADSNEVRTKLQKINRFRDFVNACQSLIRKYPDIETELLQMVRDNDFDARIASARVDTIIRLSENTSITNTIIDVEQDIHQLEDIIENLPSQIQPTELSSENKIRNKEEPMMSTENTHDSFKRKNLNLNNEDLKPLPESETIDEEKEKQYIDFEEIPNEDFSDVDNVVNFSKENPTISIDNKNSIKNSNISTVKKILWVVTIIASAIILWIIVKFVINHWTTILWILGICAVFALLFWYLFKRKK